MTIVDFTPDPEMSYWPTPAAVAHDLLDWIVMPGHADGGGEPQVRVLEPSAGEGHLVRAIRERLPKAHITAVEPNPMRAAKLRTMPGVEVIEATLEQYLVDVAMQALAGQWEPFDMAVMNPPFTLRNRPQAWADHVLAVYHDPYLLTDCGLVGAVVPHVLLTGSETGRRSKRVRAMRELLTFCGQAEACRRGAFARTVGAKVSAAIMWAQKPPDPAQAVGRFPRGLELTGN